MILFDLEVTNAGSILDEVETADAIAVGSLTINGDAVKPVWDFLSSLATIKMRGKAAAAFGCYGWSGESIQMIRESLDNAGFTIINDGLKAQWNPTDESRQECVEYGIKFARAVK